MTEQETYVGPEQEYPEFWNPQPGETISGKMVSVHVMQGDYGPTPVVTIEAAGEKFSILVRGTVFREEMAERKPKPGDELEITYLGKKLPKSGKGKPYHVYRVLGGTEPEFDWDSFADVRHPGTPAPSSELPIAAAPVPTASAVSTDDADDDLPF